MRIVFTISHGNANVERGFSVNKECLIENLQEKSLIARRVVYDAVNDVDGIENVSITKAMIQSVKNSRSLYEEDKKKNRLEKEQQDNEGTRKRKISQQVAELEKKKLKLMQESKKGKDDIDEQILLLKKQI